MKRIRIFISSVQSEFAEERAMLCHYIRTDALLGKFFEPFIFEEVPANEFPTSHVYLKEVEMCDIYLGLYGNLYGYEDEEGISPTEREYDLAAKLHKSRQIFIKSIDEDRRHPKETALIRKVEMDIVRKTFVDIDGLRTSVYASLVRYLEEKEFIRWKPFDASCDNGATLDDLDEDKMRNFIYMARSKRNFPLPVETSPAALLAHLDLIDDNGRIANAAFSAMASVAICSVRVNFRPSIVNETCSPSFSVDEEKSMISFLKRCTAACRFSASLRNTSSASFLCLEMNTGEDVIIFDFSVAILDIVFPRISVCSSSTGVRNTASGSIVFVASSLPPIPVSITASVHPYSLKRR